MGAFFKSFWSRMGRNTGNRVSNAIFGDKWSTPYRVGVDKDSVKGKSNSKNSSKNHKKEYARYAAGEADLKEALALHDRFKTERQIRDTFEKVSAMKIPTSESELVEMLHTLAFNFSAAGAFKGASAASKALRNSIYIKYSQALKMLEYRYPDNPMCWSFFLGKWRMFFARKPWSWIWVVYAIVLFCGTYEAVTRQVRSDINLVVSLWAIPVIGAAIVLISRHIRLRQCIKD